MEAKTLHSGRMPPSAMAQPPDPINVDSLTLMAIVIALLLLPLLITGFTSF